MVKLLKKPSNGNKNSTENLKKLFIINLVFPVHIIENLKTKIARGKEFLIFDLLK